MDQKQTSGATQLRRDFRAIQRLYGDSRSAERLVAHYQTEVGLVARLKDSSRETRSSAYQELYSQLLARVPDHPRRTRKADAARNDVRKMRQMLSRFVRRGDQVLEIGAGDGALALALAPDVARICAVDVDDALAPAGDTLPANVTYRLADGVRLPVANGEFTFAFSNQLLEHIHPDDTADHLREVRRALAPGGRYLVLTPNRIAGPHDVSRYFDREAKGTHLREFDARGLAASLREAGFARVQFYAARGGHVFSPLAPGVAYALDALFARVPAALHTRVVRSKPVRTLLGLVAIGYA